MTKKMRNDFYDSHLRQYLKYDMKSVLAGMCLGAWVKIPG